MGGRKRGRAAGEGLQVSFFLSFFFLPLLWMRYCLVVEHSWETSGHVDSRERAHTVVQEQGVRESYYYSSMCLSVSFFLPFSNILSPLFFFLRFFQFFALFLLCGFTSKKKKKERKKRTGGFLGLQTFWIAAACCAADVMGEELRAYIDSHRLVSLETWVVAQFHPS